MSPTDLVAIVSALLSAGAAFGSLRTRLSTLEASVASLTQTQEEINIRVKLLTVHYLPTTLRPN